MKRFEWFRTLRQLDDKFVLEHSSLDAYLYLRFLRTIIFTCFVGVCITWPILLPINATGGGHSSQLDRLGFGNVCYKDRLYAHAVVAWLFFGFVMFIIARERMWLIGLLQAWYLSGSNASRLSSRTVLYLDPPKDVSSTSGVQENFGDRAKTQWIVHETKPLDDLVEARDAKTMKLEYAEVAFIRQATKKMAKTLEREDSAPDPTHPSVESARPRERTYYIAGNAADLIDRLRSDVQETADKVNNKRQSYEAQDSTSKPDRSAIFVEYSDQLSAQRAYRGDSSKPHIPVPPNLAIKSRLIGVVPNEINWRNLAMPQAERLSKKTLANVFIALLIVFWSIPTAIVGTISNLNYLATFDGLHWIGNLPNPLLGLLIGFLPPFLTSLLASYVPNLMRRMYPMLQNSYALS